MPIIHGARPLYWTHHSKVKMRVYGLSEQRVRRVIHAPKRVEEGIAPKTMAMMQVVGNVKRPHEIWVMIRDEKARRKIISAWRYPGTTKPRSDFTRNFLNAEYDEYMAQD